MENLLSWITKIEPGLMMEVSLVLSVRQLHDRENHLSQSKISGFKNLEKEEPILGDNGIVRMSPLFGREAEALVTRDIDSDGI